MIVSSISSTEIALPVAHTAATTTQQTTTPVDQKYYYSPALTVDPQTETAVLEYRNSTTGAVIAQYPSEKDLQAYQQHQLQSTTDQKTTTDATAAATADTQTVSSATKASSGTDAVTLAVAATTSGQPVAKSSVIV